MGSELFEISTLSERATVAAEDLSKWWAGQPASSAASLQALEAARAQLDYAAFLRALLAQGDALLRPAAGGAAPAAGGTAPAGGAVAAAATAESYEDAVSAFALVQVLLSASPSSARAALVQRVADVVASAAALTEPRVAQAARLRVLASLLNSLRTGAGGLGLGDVAADRALQLFVLQRLVAFAADTRQLEPGGPVAAYLDGVRDWAAYGVSAADAPGLFQLVSASFGKVGAAEEEQQWLMGYLQALDGSAAASSAAALSAARTVALNYLKAPAGAQRYEVPRLEAVSFFPLERPTVFRAPRRQPHMLPLPRPPSRRPARLALVVNDEI
jgi:hypothetical protein